MAQPRIQAPKGTEDVLPADAGRWQSVERIARDVAARFNFGELRTPVFEHTELFHRGAGETTDVVRKETYTFEDRGGRSITLRPEGTAGAVRAVIENGLIDQQGARVKVYYLGSNFRYERPQSGRLRIHHQFGAEAFGIAEPEQDVECILLQLSFYRACGLRDLALRVNSLGDHESKQRYRDALVAYFAPMKDKLSEDSQRRLDENPLRILDSKAPNDIDASRDAPSASTSLTDKSRQHIDRVQQLLGRAGVTFTLDPHLVRGFDYYTDTLWEVTAGGLGAQNAVGGGGRYDNLVEQLGGRPTPGVGFGSGLERLLLALKAQDVALPLTSAPLVWLAYHGDAGRDACLTLALHLRDSGIRTDLDPTGKKIGNQFKLADREQATRCIIIGDNEIATNTVQLKDLKTGEQSTVARGELVARLTAST
jgi:histidyl-tRNA synthetase